MMLDRLAALAGAADEGYTGAHPRDSNNWQANEAFCRACDPTTILALVEVAKAAKAVVTSNEGSFTGFFDKVDALRSALKSVEPGQA